MENVSQNSAFFNWSFLLCFSPSGTRRHSERWEHYLHSSPWNNHVMWITSFAPIWFPFHPNSLRSSGIFTEMPSYQEPQPREVRGLILEVSDIAIARCRGSLLAPGRVRSTMRVAGQRVGRCLFFLFILLCITLHMLHAFICPIPHMIQALFLREFVVLHAIPPCLTGKIISSAVVWPVHHEWYRTLQDNTDQFSCQILIIT